MIVFASDQRECGDLKPEIASVILPSQRHLLKVLLLLTFSMGVTQGAGQDSLAYTLRQDNLSTNNDLKLNYTFQFDKTSLLVNDMVRYKVYDYKSNIAQGKQYSVEHKLQSDLMWGKNRNGAIRLESSQYQDHRTGLASSINNWALFGGYSKSDDYSFLLGGRSVERYGITDRGWSARLRLKNAWHSDTQRTSVLVSGYRDQLSEHLNHSFKTNGDYLVKFSTVSSFQSSIRFENRQQEFFTDSLGSSQARHNENIVWKNHFAYNLGKNLKLFHDLSWGDQLTEINQKKVEQTSVNYLSGEERKRLTLVNETGIKFDQSDFSSFSTFKIENSQNKYYVDYTQVLYQLREDMTWKISGQMDSLLWKNTLSRLEYDTPDTTNDDDRDEWRLKTELNFIFQPSPFYRLDFGGKLSLFHLIYLFNTRSSENYWNRNMVFWAGFKWRKNSWEGSSRANIRSNYFDYDYDDLFIVMDQPTRSFVHRSLDLNEKLSYHFNYRWSIVSKVAARWEDEGQLDWAEFIQQVSSEREQVELSSKLFFSHNGWKGWIGYLKHTRETSYLVANRDAELWSGEGPLFGASHNLGRRLFLDLDARIISVTDRDREYILPKIFFTLAYK